MENWIRYTSIFGCKHLKSGNVYKAIGISGEKMVAVNINGDWTSADKVPMPEFLELYGAVNV